MRVNERTTCGLTPLPTTSVWATNVSSLSTSLIVRVPPVVSAAFVSFSATIALDSTAVSLVPLIVTLTVVVVPSVAATVKVSSTESPTFRVSNASFAV